MLRERVRPVGPVTDDDVIMQGEPDHSRRLGEPLREVAILSGRRGVAPRVIVSDREAVHSEQPQGRPQDFSRMDQGRVQGADGNLVGGHQAVLVVQVEGDEVLARVVGNQGPGQPNDGLGTREAGRVSGVLPEGAELDEVDAVVDGTFEGLGGALADGNVLLAWGV